MVFTDSAGRHGVREEDAVWAIEHALLVKPQFQRARFPGTPDPTLFVGPDTLGRLIEVMAVHVDGEPVIFHAMRARKAFLDLIDPNRKGGRR